MSFFAALAGLVSAARPRLELKSTRIRLRNSIDPVAAWRRINATGTESLRQSPFNRELVQNFRTGNLIARLLEHRVRLILDRAEDGGRILRRIDILQTRNILVAFSDHDLVHGLRLVLLLVVGKRAPPHITRVIVCLLEVRGVDRS